ncbi:MAG: hypothetical protein R6X13_11590 [bacterium]
MSDMISVAWQRAMHQLEEDGMSIAVDEETVLETVRQDFENLAAPIQDQPGFEDEAPKLAAWMVTYALERDRIGLTDYESF